MQALDIKVLRDLRRMWAQALAIALVLACGVATLILAVGTYRSLEETRQAYYDRYRFGDVFAAATRAPKQLGDQIRAIPGVAAMELRIVKPVLLDIAGMVEPATGMAISLPDHGEPAVNALYLREGRLPEAGRDIEVVINENFAKAHGFTPGSDFKAILNGSKTDLHVVGIALSPEYVYALGPGDLLPDNKRFGLLWMSEKALAGRFDLDGAFNSLSLRLSHGASAPAVIDAVDRVLQPYGGSGAYGRKDQVSDAFLDSELTALAAMARVTPPIFLLVSAFLINMVLSRLIALEREQIGLLKALGYRGGAIASHYLKLVVLIALLGTAIGFVAGTWLGRGMTRIYAEYYTFPFLIFRQNADIYAIGALVSLLAAVGGAAKAVYSVLALKPAVAMRPPAPPVFHQFLGGAVARARIFSQLTVMALRHIIRWPVRAAFGTLGTALSVAVLVLALFTLDSTDFMIDVIYFQTERQDASLHFESERPASVMPAVAKLPGVLRAEPYRSLAVKIRHGQYERRLSIIGKPKNVDLARVLDLELHPIALPESGVAVSERVADILHVKVGDLVRVQFLEGKRRTVEVPVTEVIQSYIGLMVYMDIDALDGISGTGPRVSGAYLELDQAAINALYRAAKETPVLSGVTLQTVALQNFRDSIKQNIVIMTTVYVTLSVIIAFGVVYNSARIQLSERARELATLRVLGFTRAEVSQVLLTELGVGVAAAQPLGWLIGYGFAFAVIKGFASDLYRVPFVVSSQTFVIASLVVFGAALVSAFVVRRRIDRFDLVQVLKTRE